VSDWQLRLQVTVANSAATQTFNRQALLAKFSHIILKHDRLEGSPEQLLRLSTDADGDHELGPMPNGEAINVVPTGEVANSFLVDAFVNHEVFKRLPVELVEELLTHMKPVTLKKGEILFQAGDQGTNMFVVHTGSIACITTQGKEVKVLTQGAPTCVVLFCMCCFPIRPLCPMEAIRFELPASSGAVFGELAALGLNQERTLTMKAVSFVMMYRLAGEAISTVLGDRPEVCA
jgi:CRP-like cAMP-binding protein